MSNSPHFVLIVGGVLPLARCGCHHEGQDQRGKVGEDPQQVNNVHTALHKSGNMKIVKQSHQMWAWICPSSTLRFKRSYIKIEWLQFCWPLMTYSIFLGAAINRMTYSKVNHPTNTASAISKKYSSSEKIVTIDFVVLRLHNMLWCSRIKPFLSFF